MRTWRILENAAFNYDPSADYISDPSCIIGPISVTCEHCEAKKWIGEAPGMCCNGGKVQLPRLMDPPESLRTLLIGDSAEVKHFLNNIRRRQCRTSRAALQKPSANKTRHSTSVARYAGSSQLLRPELQISLEFKVVILADKTPHGEHERRFNAPTTDEVALIMVGEQHGAMDILLEERSGTIKKISDTHRSYDVLQYPLIIWQGEDGYHFELRQRNPMTGMPQNKKISAMQFYACRMMQRSTDFNILLRSKGLFHQFIVDMYAKIESERLLYIRLNQRTLRVEQYAHLRDAVMNVGKVADIGQLIILPSSFTGGPRYMHERTQDAMT
ncbi:hypothetical protein AVEN_90864-1 [Araneus ventricosus]|uniref:Helitron helicase-like domain-containing protein n=1 Tax=Araneus ventricosus TaxID=182803 RepID=A0A4Y2LM99_ARAVE|nr:hypothetical protein AVEN_90864-1 [Araneus ventricosus]